MLPAPVSKRSRQLAEASRKKQMIDNAAAAAAPVVIRPKDAPPRSQPPWLLKLLKDRATYFSLLPLDMTQAMLATLIDESVVAPRLNWSGARPAIEPSAHVDFSSTSGSCESVIVPRHSSENPNDVLLLDDTSDAHSRNASFCLASTQATQSVSIRAPSGSILIAGAIVGEGCTEFMVAQREGPRVVHRLVSNDNSTEIVRMFTSYSPGLRTVSIFRGESGSLCAAMFDTQNRTNRTPYRTGRLCAVVMREWDEPARIEDFEDPAPVPHKLLFCFVQNMAVCAGWKGSGLIYALDYGRDAESAGNELVRLVVYRVSDGSVVNCEVWPVAAFMGYASRSDCISIAVDALHVDCRGRITIVYSRSERKPPTHTPYSSYRAPQTLRSVRVARILSNFGRTLERADVELNGGIRDINGRATVAIVDGSILALNCDRKLNVYH
jgi:hypothetical protein